MKATNLIYLRLVEECRARSLERGKFVSLAIADGAPEQFRGWFIRDEPHGRESITLRHRCGWEARIHPRKLADFVGYIIADTIAARCAPRYGYPMPDEFTRGVLSDRHDTVPSSDGSVRADDWDAGGVMTPPHGRPVHLPRSVWGRSLRARLREG